MEAEDFLKKAKLVLHLKGLLSVFAIFKANLEDNKVI